MVPYTATSTQIATYSCKAPPSSHLLELAEVFFPIPRFNYALKSASLGLLCNTRMPMKTDSITPSI